MKKAITLLLTLCTLLCTLTACHSRRDDIIEKYSDTESSTVESDGTDEAFTDDMTIPEDLREASVSLFHGNPYAGMTKQELEELYRQSYTVSNEKEWKNTPYYYIYETTEGGSAFSKLTGEVVQLCKDPLCDHTECIFSTGVIRGLTVSEDRVYFLMDDPAKHNAVLYEADFAFDHLAKLYTWAERMDKPDDIFYHNGKLYYWGAYRAKGETQKRVFVFDIEQKQVSLLEDGDEPRFKHFSFIQGPYLYYPTYNENNDGSFFRRYDLDTGEDSCAVPASFLHPEEGDLGMILYQAEPDGIHIHIYVIKQGSGGDQFEFDMYRYNVETGEYALFTKMPMCGGYVVQWVNHTTDEYKDDPFYEYYVNDMGPDKADNSAGGELLIYESDGMTLVGTLRFLTDDIPDLLIWNTMSSDGRCIYIRYVNWTGFRNVFNPDFNMFAVVYNPELAATYGGQMVIDIARLKVLDMGPENHQIEWIPAK